MMRCLKHLCAAETAAIFYGDFICRCRYASFTTRALSWNPAADFIEKNLQAYYSDVLVAENA